MNNLTPEEKRLKLKEDYIGYAIFKEKPLWFIKWRMTYSHTLKGRVSYEATKTKPKDI